MPIKGIDEFGLIRRFNKRIRVDSSVVKGSGDDCAVLKYGSSRYQLFTCDMIVEGVDFNIRDNPYLIGRKAMAVSISDIAACAGLPRHCLVSLGIPKNIRFKFLNKVFTGMLNMTERFYINIAGGDISRCNKLVINVCMIGEVEKKNLVLRSQARIGDFIFVTGNLGGSIYGKHFTFTPRIKEARYLVENFKINSMIDISDGLSQDLGHILEQSRVGAVIYEELIPVSNRCRSLTLALESGEDYELLFTLSRKEAIRLLKKKINRFKPIGEIVNERRGLRLIDKQGIEKIIKPHGFKHF